MATVERQAILAENGNKRIVIEYSANTLTITAIKYLDVTNYPSRITCLIDRGEITEEVLLDILSTNAANEVRVMLAGNKKKMIEDDEGNLSPDMTFTLGGSQH